MEQIMHTLDYEGVPDKELTIMNGIFQLFATYGIDNETELRILKYLLERARKGK